MDSIRTETLEALERQGEEGTEQLLETVETLNTLEARLQETVDRLPVIHSLIADLELYR